MTDNKTFSNIELDKVGVQPRTPYVPLSIPPMIKVTVEDIRKKIKPSEELSLGMRALQDSKTGELSIISFDLVSK